MNALQKKLYQQLNRCQSPQRFRLKQRINRLEKIVDTKNKAYIAIQQQIDRSIQQRSLRLDNIPNISYPEILPISARHKEISEIILKHQVTILCGATGSGKTTQLPKICLSIGRGVDGLIGHTQPRRLAARTVATRIAEELNSATAVGYKIRFQDHTKPETYIKLMTDGILLAEIQQDRYLSQYDTLIIDEAHERSLNIDFIMAYLKWLLPRRRDLKVIITSATIDPERFAKHFDNAPVIEVSGRTYPVEIRYRPPNGFGGKEAIDLYEAIIEAVDELKKEAYGDILIFLSGEREIRDATELLQKQNYRNTDILPLFARLSNAEQNRIFKPHSRQHIILATNIAETSLTVPGIKYVIDTGLARISRYSWRSRIQRLPIEAISQASANQRSGRCGRTSNGIAIRLYDEKDFELRSEFTDPEILRTNLASVILQLIPLRIGTISNFPFIEAPDSRLIRDGYKLLFELQAVTKDQRITKIGKQLAHIPIDPQLARMLLEAEKLGTLKEVLIIVSALSIQDPRERPIDKQQAADEKHSRFKEETSDFIGYLKLWEYFNQQRKLLSQNQLRKLCRKEFIAYMRMREWQDIHQQIKQSLNHPKINEHKAGIDSIHQSLLSGLLSHIGYQHQNKEFLGANNRKLLIFPGSFVSKKQPKWIMAAELVETSRLFARVVGKIQPEWLEQAAKHLINRQYSEPHWQEKSAHVGAFERTTLYGLTITAKRLVNYGNIDPVISRELFIRHALVYGEYQCNGIFFNHNRNLINEIENLEAKSRRRDILVSEERLYDFYDQRLPDHIHNGQSFEKWRKTIEHDDKTALYFDKNILLQRDTDHISDSHFPDKMTVLGVALPLSYHFDPSHKADGVTVQVPQVLLNQLADIPFQYLVQGMLLEKITSIIRALPKQVRKQFVPAPEYAMACFEAISDESKLELPLLHNINQQLQRMTGNQIPEDLYNELILPTHCLMNFQIINQKGNILDSGRNLEKLQGKQENNITKEVSILSQKHSIEQTDITTWNFADLEPSIDRETHGIKLKAYPALVDKKSSVAIQLFDTEDKATQAHAQGLLRLFILEDSTHYKQHKRQLANTQKLCLLFSSIGSCEQLKQGIMEASYRETFVSIDIRQQESFQHALQKNHSQLAENIALYLQRLEPILSVHLQIKKQLKQAIQPQWLEAIHDINEQLNHLIYRDFILKTNLEELRHYPRYLKGILRRLDKLKANPQRDRGLRQQVQSLWQQYRDFIEKKPAQKIALSEYRWQIEELRISLFAQELGTLRPVSAKRLEKLWKQQKNK
ncbi:MAG: ATP-dependent RNA helicase HrpA [Thiotrichaceae bacterium]|nr:ATP-dependent RNA helicase HrpA [Thiotrichaceae bacterium]